jgi:outer membrane receptor protein involved in Fe transport
LAWGAWSRGIKSGGFTAYNTTNVAQLAAFAPEQVDAVELGAKLEPLRTLRANVAVYHNDYRRQQVLSTVYDQVSRGPIGRIVNAPVSVVQGAELEVQWLPTRWLSLTPFAAFTEGHFQDFVTVDAQASITQQREVSRDFSGTALPIPRWSFGGAATGTWLRGAHWLQAELSSSYRDTQTASRLIFSPRYDVAPYALVNGTLAWARAGSRWRVELWGRNLLDRRYELTRNFFINAQVAARGAPRMAGIRLRVER